MKLIDQLHKMADETVEAIQWPYRKKAIRRAFESTIDNAESERLRVESDIAAKQRELTKITDENQAKPIIKSIIEARIELEEAQHISDLATKELAALFDAEAISTDETPEN